MSNTLFHKKGQLKKIRDGTNGFVKTDELSRDIFVEGKERMNRTIHGDAVIVQLLPFSEW